MINIIKGWFFSKVYAPKYALLRSAKRLKHCNICTDAVDSEVLRFINGDAIVEKTKKCKGCGCPIVEKSLVKNEKCPKNKWI